jgi:Na+/proline symporter
MTALSGLDYEIVAAILAVTLILGVCASRLAGRSLEHYFLGGRNLPWYVLGVSGMSNLFDLTGTMIITSFLYIMGPLGLYVEFRGGVVLVLAFMLAFTNKWGRRSGCMTPAEWNTYRFGIGASAGVVRFFTAAMGILITIGGLSFMVRGATLFMGLMFPVNPVLLTLGIVAFAAIYTVLAGFYGVVLTDLLQGVIMIAGCIAISCIAWHLVPSAASLSSMTEKVTGNAQWVGAAPRWYVDTPKGYEAYHFLIVVALFYFARNVLGGFGNFNPIALAARNTREASQLCLVQALTVMFRWPLMISFAILGIAMVARIAPDRAALARAAESIHASQPGLTDNNWHEFTSHLAHHPEDGPPGLADRLTTILGPNWRQSLVLVSHQGTVDPELILPAVILSELTPGLRGFILAALLSALMGALTSHVNASSALFVRDIYQNILRPKAKNRELLTAAYLSSLAIIAAGFFLGLKASNINDIWVWYVMSLIAGTIGTNLLRFYWWRVNAWGMACGFLAGGGGALLQRFLYPSMPEFWQFLVMTVLSFAGTIIASLLTEPLPDDVTRRFYLTTRPFGFWKPFRDALPANVRAAWRREHRNDLIATAVALVWQVSLFMLPMQFLTHNWPAFFCIAPVLAVSSVGLYFFWWKNLPPPDEHVPDFAGRPPVHSMEELKAAEAA